MDEKSTLLSSLFDKKTVEILKKLLLKKDIFYLRDISRETGVPLATTFRIVQKLVGMGLVGREQQDKFTWYKLNRDSQTFKEVHELVIGAKQDPLELFKTLLKEKFEGSFSAFVTKDKDKKVFIISDLVKTADVEEVSKKFIENSGFKPNYMVVTPQFFEQMQTMGLIAKDKLGSL